MPERFVDRLRASPARFIAPNALTVSRPFIARQAFKEIKKGNRKKGYALLATAWATDADGKVARATNATSKIGYFLDPIADRLMLAFMLRELKMSRGTKAVAIIAESGIAIGALALSKLASSEMEQPSTSLVGKARFTAHFGSALYLLENPGDKIASRAMAGASVAAAADYANQARKTLKK